MKTKTGGKMKNIIYATALTSLLYAGGCGTELKDVQRGVVREEFGSLPSLVESTGAILPFGNETIKLGDRTYGLVVDTPNGNIFLRLMQEATKQRHWQS